MRREVWVLELLEAPDDDSSKELEVTIRDVQIGAQRVPDMKAHAESYKRVHSIDGRVVRYVPEEVAAGSASRGIEDPVVSELIEYAGQLKNYPLNREGVLKLALDLRDARAEIARLKAVGS